MSSSSIVPLNDDYAIPGGLTFETHPSGLVMGQVSTKKCRGTFFLHGAHVTHFQPTSAAKPILFLSEQSWFASDKPIRGGIPICFPWFGPHPTEADKPAHGWARLRDWQVTETALLGEDVFVQLSLDLDEWRLHYQILFGQSLELNLLVTNTADRNSSFEAALHTYFQIQEIDRCQIAGLESIGYLDQLTRTEHAPTGSPIVFREETDRIYQGVCASVSIHDLAGPRVIEVEPRHSASTVVWNPWVDKSLRMPDFGDEEYLKMCCVETANVRANKIELSPGSQHRMGLTLKVSG
jgi:glucose-6-phosphate 1-epimerase